ncbi:IS3 family transposase [Leptolyngbya sp. 7M]|nr:IS3 family transposase [Leptolyngbya sp. 7M]
MVESCFGTLKTEFIHGQSFVREVAKTAIVDWIEVFYNRQRIDSRLSDLSPVQFEQQYWLSLQQPKAA